MHTFCRLMTSLILLASLSSCGTIKGLLGEDEPVGDIMVTLADAGVYRTFISAVQTAGLVDIMSGSKVHTVFAPTDRAFEKLPAGTMDALLTPPYQPQLKQLVRNHIVVGEYSADDLNVQALQIKTLNNEWIAIDNSENIKVNNATVVRADLKATNGIVHRMSSVVAMPQLQ